MQDSGISMLTLLGALIVVIGIVAVFLLRKGK
jgi:hypothetical protein